MNNISKFLKAARSALFISDGTKTAFSGFSCNGLLCAAVFSLGLYGTPAEGAGKESPEARKLIQLFGTAERARKESPEIWKLIQLFGAAEGGKDTPDATEYMPAEDIPAESIPGGGEILFMWGGYGGVSEEGGVASPATKVAAASENENPEGEGKHSPESSAEDAADQFINSVRTDIEALESEYADIESGLSLLKEERRDNRKARKELQARRYEAERTLFFHYRDFFRQAVRNKSISSAETLRLAAVIPLLENVEDLFSSVADLLSDGRQEAHFATGVSMEQQAHDEMAAESAAAAKKEEETITAFGLLDLSHEIHDVSEAVFDNTDHSLEEIMGSQRNIQRELLTLYRRFYNIVVSQAENEQCNSAQDLDCRTLYKERKGGE